MDAIHEPPFKGIVNLFRHGIEGRPYLGNGRHYVALVVWVAADPVERIAEEDIGLATAYEREGLHELLTGKEFIPGSRFPKGGHGFPPLRGRVGLTFCELGFETGSVLFLLVGADPAIDGYSRIHHDRRSRDATSSGEK